MRPAAAAAPPAPRDTPPDALERLSARLDQHPDFPALQAHVTKVTRVARDERARLQSLSDALSDDPGLSGRLLRLANSAYYRSTAGVVTTMQRAVALFGFEHVQRLAVGQKLLDRVPHDGRGALLREDFLRSMLAGRVAAELCGVARELEDARLTATFVNLGRMLAAAYLGDEALQVRHAVGRRDWPYAAAEQRASRRAWGSSYADLGQHVARRWAWPEGLSAAMRRDEGWPAHVPVQRSEALRLRAQLANDLADLILYVDAAQWELACARLAREAGTATGETGKSMLAALARARQGLAQLAEAVGLPLSRLDRGSAPAGEGVEAPADGASAPPDAVDLPGPAMSPQAIDTPAGSGPGAAPDVPAPADACTGSTMTGAVEVAFSTSAALPFPASASDVEQPVAPPSAHGPITLGGRRPDADLGRVVVLPAPGRAAAEAVVASWLAEEVERLSRGLLDGAGAARVPGQVAAALCRGLRARRAVLFRAAGPRGTLLPIEAHGEPLGEAARDWRIEPVGGSDLFARVCARHADTLIHDARLPEIARHLPAAWHRAAGAAGFLLLPLVAQGRLLGLLYVERRDDAPLALGERDMQLVRTLRNQAAMALALPAPVAAL